MIRQCSKCLLLMGEKPPLSDTRITHTYCDKCLKELQEQADKEYKEYIRHKKQGM